MFHLSTLVPQLYLALPVLAVVIASLRARRRQTLNPIRDIIVTLFAGGIAGWTLVWVYAHQLPGRMPMSQYFIAAYWGSAVACALRFFNAALTWGCGRIVPTLPDGQPRRPGAALTAKFFASMILLAVSALHRRNASLLSAKADSARRSEIDSQGGLSACGISLDRWPRVKRLVDSSGPNLQHR